jgi:hypothetical protein
LRRPGAAAIVGAGAVSALGLGWRGLGRALREGAARFSEVPPLPPGDDVPAKTRKLMSRAAHLSALAMREALRDAGWTDRLEEVGCYAGIGGGGGPPEALESILGASLVDGRLDPRRFVEDGLGTTNPLVAFHLLNNYVLCHGAILCGLGGPNAAFHSRGAGTHTALEEALWALSDRDCSRTLIGGADCALHPGTRLELLVDGRDGEGFVPAEGAAFLALAAEAERPLATIEACRCSGADGRPELAPLLDELPEVEVGLTVIAGGATSTRARLLPELQRRWPRAAHLDLGAVLGDALAATPALGWVAALDLLQEKTAAHACVVNVGVDGSLGAVLLGGPS